MLKYLTLSLLAALACILSGCGDNSSAVVSVAVSPTSATIRPGATQQFTATVQHASNTAVTWQVNGIESGNSTYGTIDSGGLYTAPTSLSGATLTITAVSVADTTKTATASLTIETGMSVSPSIATVTAGQTQQFAASVTFSTNTAVTWQVNGVVGGDSSHGTIDSSGLYTAPTALPNPSTVTVTAVSQANSAYVATASVYLVAPSIVISPTDVTMPAGSQQVFAATVSTQAYTPIWSVQCDSTKPADCGTITSDGVYTAPAAPPRGGSVIIKASAPDSTAVPATTKATVQFSDASLMGTYVFAFKQQARGLHAEAGVIRFDGTGNVISGSFDSSDKPGSPVKISGGAYNVSADGRGDVTLQTDAGVLAWSVSLKNHSTGYAVRVGSDGIPASGDFVLQEGVTPAVGALAGSYVVSVTGASTNESATPFAMVGNIVAGGAGQLTRGVLDIDSDGNVLTNAVASGTYSGPDDLGRGLLTLTSALGVQTFACYQVNEDHLKAIEIGAQRAAVGDLVRARRTSTTSTNLAGRYAFTVRGGTSGAPLAIGGLFTLNGSAGVTDRLLDGVEQTIFDTHGSYFVTDPESGRTTLTWTVENGAARKYVLYPREDGVLAMLEIDGVVSAHGLAFPRTLTSPTIYSVIGHFATTLLGTHAQVLESVTGQVALTGASTISGSVDVIHDTALTVGSTLQAGAFSVDSSTGHAVASVLSDSGAVSNSRLVMYIVDPDTALLLISDAERRSTGTLLRQY